MGRILVIPSRAESLPYIVLEAAASGMPIIASNVGGVPEIFGAHASHLVASDDLAALAGAIAGRLDDPATAHRVAAAVQARVRKEFSLQAMVDGGLAAYRDALALRKLAQFA
jgi:glycosyltransferase involved in cell wall biosynthesis